MIFRRLCCTFLIIFPLNLPLSETKKTVHKGGQMDCVDSLLLNYPFSNHIGGHNIRNNTLAISQKNVVMLIGYCLLDIYFRT